MPAKWDEKFQEAQVYIRRTKKQLPPERMNNKQFNSYLHKYAIKSLEKHNYYFEKSASHDAFEA